MPTRKNVVVPILVAINIGVFALWVLGDYSTLFFMSENFLVSWNALEADRYWVVLTSVFSHNMFLHLLFNMIVLRSFGTFLELILGKMFFLKFYLAAGIFSSLCHAFVSKFLLDAPQLPALGASGAISGLIIIFSFMFPKEKLSFFGIIPVPALAGALVFIGLDVWGLIAQTQGGGLPIGHGAHLGGSIAGIFCYMKFIRPRLQTRSPYEPLM